MAIYKKDLLNKLRAYATTPDDETTQYKEKIKQALMKSPELLYALHEEELETRVIYCEDENGDLVLNIDEETGGYLVKWTDILEKVQISVLIYLFPETQTEVNIMYVIKLCLMNYQDIMIQKIYSDYFTIFVNGKDREDESTVCQT